MNKLGHIVLSSAFFLLLVSISITFTGYREHIYAEKAVNSVKDNIRFYACGQYASQFVHCDPSINKRQSYELKAGKIIQLHNITNDNPTYVNSNHGKAAALEFKDERHQTRNRALIDASGDFVHEDKPRARCERAGEI